MRLPHHELSLSFERPSNTHSSVTLRAVRVWQHLICHTQVRRRNGSFSADGMANALAAVLSATVTNPTGSGWFDRYGLENSTITLFSSQPILRANFNKL